MKIDPEILPVLSRLLDEWLDLPPEGRAGWLESLGPEYTGILPAFRRLVSTGADAAGEEFLRTLPKVFSDGFPASEIAAATTGLAAGARLGPYRLLREVGRGGMGVVWLAERADGTLKREVALKIPFVSLHNQTLAARFVRERDILAGLAHPNIARLYDAGVTAQGQPYLALEFVEGEPINSYCDRLRLGVNQRLTLFLDVLRAVQYAHTNLIVHRDLKPSNILVTQAAEVRLLDFGIAKLLIEGDEPETQLTRVGGQPLTPDYASPEQVNGEVVTAAADVYSLGVLLYELITGQRPYRVKRNTRRGLEEAIVSADVVPPSRAAAAGKLARALKGDLDTITLKALQKQPQLRYASADAFAQDIARYLRGEAVLAQPQSAWYLARKFVRRNLLAAGSAAAVVAALSVGLGIVVVEKRHAQTEAATSKALSDFLQNDLLEQASARAQSGPNNRPNPDLKVRDALDRAAARIPGKFDSEPAVEAAIRETIGKTYRDLGLYAEAQPQMERALDLRRRALGPEHLDTLQSMNELSLLYIAQSKYAQSDALLTEEIGIRRRLQGNDHRDTLSAMNNLTIVLTRRGDYARAANLLAGILDVQRRTLGEEHPDTIVVMNNLASVYVDQGKYGPAEGLYKRAAEIKRRTLGEEHPSTLRSMNNLGIVFRNEGKYTQAEETLTTVLDTRRRLLGADHPDTLDSASSLGLLYQAEGRYEQAEPLLKQVLEVRRRVLGAEHSTTLASVNNLAELYRRQGRREQAEALFTQLLDARRRVLGPDHPNTIQVLVSLGAIRRDERRYAEAEPLLRAAWSGHQKTGTDSWQRYYTQSMLGATLKELGRAGEAGPLLTAGYAGLVERQESIPADTRSIVDEARKWVRQ